MCLEGSRLRACLWGVGVGGGSAALDGGKEAQARCWRAGSRPQSGSVGRRGGSQPKRRVHRFLKRRQLLHACVVQHCRAEAAVRSQRAPRSLGPRECRQILIMPSGIIRYTFTFTYIN